MNTKHVSDAGVPHRGARVRASMPEPPHRSTGSLLVSVLLHAVVIVLVVYATATVVEPRAGLISDAILGASGGGGGGGQGGTEFAVAPPPIAPPPEVLQPEPIPVPQPTPPQIIPQELPAVAPSRDSVAGGTALGPGSGGGTGGGEGTGTGTGTGSGTGPGSGEGTGGGSAPRRGRPASSRGLMLPPLDAPKSLRGKSVTVTFTLTADGKVIDIAVAPPIADRGYAKTFHEVMRAYTFRPATDSTGQAIASTLIAYITF